MGPIDGLLARVPTGRWGLTELWMPPTFTNTHLASAYSSTHLKLFKKKLRYNLYNGTLFRCNSISSNLDQLQFSAKSAITT